MFPPEKSPVADSPSRPRRWYDHDPVLMELLSLLELFKHEIGEQARDFLAQVETALGPAAVRQASQAIEAYLLQRRRWYDDDIHLARSLELLKLLPPAQQRQLALSFLQTLRQDPRLVSDRIQPKTLVGAEPDRD